MNKTASTTGPVLVFDDVSISYKRPGAGHLTAVDRVTLDVAAGEVVGLVGESGCGKSTLARAACGLVPLAGGRIAAEGTDVLPLGLRRRRAGLLGVQMVFQNPYASLNPRRTIGRQLADALSLGRAKGVSIQDLLERVELPARSAGLFPHQFSGGQRQRIAIARALAAGPTVLIGDEPIASLDASLQSKLAMLMRDLARESGAALLFISHDLGVVRLIADRIAVMSSGRLVEVGTAEQVWAHPSNPYTARLLAAIPIGDGEGHLPEV